MRRPEVIVDRTVTELRCTDCEETRPVTDFKRSGHSPYYGYLQFINTLGEEHYSGWMRNCMTCQNRKAAVTRERKADRANRHEAWVTIGWDVQRWLQGKSGIPKSVAERVEKDLDLLVLGETVKSIQTVVKIRDDESASNRDRLDAAKWLAGLAGVAPVLEAQTSILDEDNVDDVLQETYAVTRPFTLQETPID